MKEKNKFKWQLPISVVILIIAIALGVVTVVFSGTKPIIWLLAVPAWVVTVLLTSLFHEFGHYLAAVSSGFEVYYFYFSNFVFDRAGRKRFKAVFQDEHLGEIRFFPKKEGVYHQMLKRTLRGGINGALVLAVIFAVVLFLAEFRVFGSEVSPIIAVTFSSAPYTVYSLLINAVAWFHPENDGSQIKIINKSDSERQAIDNFYSITKELFSGKTYNEIPKCYFTVDYNVTEGVKVPIMVYALRRAATIGDKELENSIASALISMRVSETEAVCELLCKYIADNNEELVTELSEVLSFCDGDDTPVVLRARLAYAKYRGDNDFFNVLKPTAIKVCEQQKLCVGDAKYQLNEINKL